MLSPEEYYYENGLLVFTERFHLRRGTCCGSGCRHCPFAHEAVPAARRSGLPPPQVEAPKQAVNLRDRVGQGPDPAVIEPGEEGPQAGHGTP